MSPNDSGVTNLPRKQRCANCVNFRFCDDLMAQPEASRLCHFNPHRFMTLEDQARKREREAKYGRR